MSSEKQYFTYIVKCSDGTYYTGKTNNLEKRIKQHNGILAGGAHYTKIRRPVTLVYIEAFAEHKAAAQREYEIKQLTRQQKEILWQKIPNEQQ